jgi:hypothetical protein
MLSPRDIEELIRKDFGSKLTPDVGSARLMKPTLRGLLVMAAGMVIAWLGFTYFLQSWTRIFGAGLFLIGVGTMSMGVTNGYADYGPTGTLLYRIGFVGFFAGLAAGGYAYYYGGMPV